MVVVAVQAAAGADSSGASTSPPQRPGPWSIERAWAWYKAHPWIVGINYHPSNVVNTTELWSAGTFDEETIDRELALAAKTGFNACRTNLQYLVWKHDPQGMKRRMERFTWWDKRGTPEPKLWFCDLYHKDHTPYDPNEIEAIRKTTADKRIASTQPRADR